MSQVEVRLANLEDADAIKQWLYDPEMAISFPMSEQKEVDESVDRWLGEFVPKGSVWMAELNGQPVGFALVFVQTYVRLLDQAMHMILVDQAYREMGAGSALLETVLQESKEKFGIELAHSEVCGSEEVVRWYKRRGFEEFARQERWMKEGDVYINRVCLERYV